MGAIKFNYIDSSVDIYLHCYAFSPVNPFFLFSFLPSLLPPFLYHTFWSGWPPYRIWVHVIMQSYTFSHITPQQIETASSVASISWDSGFKPESGVNGWGSVLLISQGWALVVSEWWGKQGLGGAEVVSGQAACWNGCKGDLSKWGQNPRNTNN